MSDGYILVGYHSLSPAINPCIDNVPPVERLRSVSPQTDTFIVLTNQMTIYL